MTEGTPLNNITNFSPRPDTQTVSVVPFVLDPVAARRLARLDATEGRLLRDMNWAIVLGKTNTPYGRCVRPMYWKPR